MLRGARATWCAACYSDWFHLTNGLPSSSPTHCPKRWEMLLSSLELKSLLGLAQKPQRHLKLPSPLHQTHSRRNLPVPVNLKFPPHPKTSIKAIQAASILLANSARMHPALAVLNQIALRLATGWGLGGPNPDLNMGAHHSPPLVRMRRLNRMCRFPRR